MIKVETKTVFFGLVFTYLSLTVKQKKSVQGPWPTGQDPALEYMFKHVEVCTFWEPTVFSTREINCVITKASTWEFHVTFENLWGLEQSVFKEK